MEGKNITDFASRAEALLKETKLLQINKSANILIDIFGIEKSFEKLNDKHIGKQIEMQFPALDNGSLTFTLVSKVEDFKCIFGKPKNPEAIIVINVKEKDILSLISYIIKLKNNIFGLLKLVPKLLTRKIKIKGSLIAAIRLCQIMMIGEHEVYTGQL